MSLVEVVREGAMLTVTMNRADKRNALNSAMIGDLMAVFSQAARNEELQVVVLAGSGGTFSAGADLEEMARLNQNGAATYIRSLHKAIQSVFTCPIPVIAAIQGPCFGGALELAAACDIRIATSDAKFAMPEVKVGVPSVIEAALLPRLVGRGRSAWLVLTGETIDAATADRWALIESMVEPAAFRHGTVALARTIMAADPKAIRAQKRLMRVWDVAPLDQAIESSVGLFARCFEDKTPNKLMQQMLKK